jgi:predicted GIY-YIG superfamily endonuclease
MHYVYTLLSLKSKTIYIGQTNDLRRRINEHNTGIGGEYTKKHRPFKLVHYEAFVSKKDAIKQEGFYKSGYGREVLKEKIENSLSAIRKLS